MLFQLGFKPIIFRIVFYETKNRANARAGADIDEPEEKEVR
jgi:hypothetical protein